MKTCFDCGCPADVDHHVVPKSKGGTAKVPLCVLCHSLVHDARLHSTAKLVRAALSAKRARGEPTGRIPYGSEVGPDGLLRPQWDEMAVLGSMRQWRAEGATLQAITDLLNKGGTPPPIAHHGGRQGKCWYPNTVRILLKRGASDTQLRLY